MDLVTMLRNYAGMYDAMCHIGEDNGIWQDRVIYAICKSIHDIITKIEKEDK